MSILGIVFIQSDLATGVAEEGVFVCIMYCTNRELGNLLVELYDISLSGT